MKYVSRSGIEGKAVAPPSKSMMQRAVAAAALANGRSVILNPSSCNDALAAIGCAKMLGARITPLDNGLAITGGNAPLGKTLDCGESGLCMRMFAPIACLSGKEFVLAARGTLALRPVGMVEGPLRQLGANCSTRNGFPPINVRGPLSGGKIGLDCSTSSQFLTGLLMALPLCRQDSLIRVSNLKSKPYAMMTISLLKEFSIEIRSSSSMDKFEITGGQKYLPASYSVEGDWSSASFLLVAGAIAGRIEVAGLDMNSRQADKEILGVLEQAGAKVRVQGETVSVENEQLRGFEFDATDCPDLFPPLVALACNCIGESRITGAERLKGKESNRGASLAREFGKCGARIELDSDLMTIAGGTLVGGRVDSCNDHRIAMACAVAALASEKGISISNAQCVSKSYPGFFEDIELLKVR